MQGNGKAPTGRRWRKGGRVRYIPDDRQGIVRKCAAGRVLVHWGTIDGKEFTSWVDASDLEGSRVGALRHRAYEVDLR